MRNFILFFVIWLLTMPLIAQEDRFFIPREIQQGYEKGTRSYDGKPGKNYWQNTVDYKISVEVIPETRELIGTESVKFHNNSPDELQILVIRLYHDAFKKGNLRGSPVKPGDINNGVQIDRIVVEGTSLNIEKETLRRGTNMIVNLPETLKSNTTANIEIDWKMVIPETTIRTGAYDSTSFFVAYWYPQVSVYDDIYGWDMLDYNFLAEFYNNLGDFDVKIKAPENFTVLATGVLQNAPEVLFDEKLELYNQAHNSTETVTILSAEDISNEYKHKSGTWHYKAGEVTDFSFCLSDHAIWDAANQKVEDQNVFISSYYNISVAEEAKQLTSDQQKTMKHFSEDMPGIPYPYPEFTTCVMDFNAPSMETPMMANNASPFLGATIHEMFHTYFPMYVRTNERRFAWMDEGWAEFNSKFLTKYLFQQDTGLIIEGDYSPISRSIGTIKDLPLITSTQFLDISNYNYTSYHLPEFIYSMLYHHLGDELFKKSYREYITTWAKKSPTPYDFFYTFERVSGEDLGWLWNPWIFGQGHVDVSIAAVSNGKLDIRNQGSRPVPVVIKVDYKDDTTWEKDFSAGIWKSKNSMTIDIPNYKNISSLSVNEALPDTNIFNNYYPTLQERYGDFEITDKYLGSYDVNEFPVALVIDKKDEFIRMSIERAEIETYLIPKDDNTFDDLRGNYKLELTEKEDGRINFKLFVKSSNLTLTGSKE